MIEKTIDIPATVQLTIIENSDQVAELKAEKENLQEQITEGKTTIANSITNNGVDTDTTATFETMADNIDTVAENRYFNGYNQGVTDASALDTESLNYKTGYNNGILDTKKGTATAENVLTGKTFTNASGVNLEGAMPNNGADSILLDCSESYTIPKGYHDGTGKVSANSLSSQTQATATAADILAGKTAYVNGSKVTGTNDSETQIADLTSQVAALEAKIPPNGKSWTQSNVTSGTFYSVYKANGIWVAGGSEGLYYSTNGKTWTQSNITSGTFLTVYNSNGIWVAGGSGNGLYYSTDGKTWTQSNKTEGTLNDVYCADGIWVACSDGGGLYYSTDGKTWTQSNIIQYTFYKVHNANGIWVAVGDDGLACSTDGKEWTRKMTSYPFKTVYNANGIWVVGGDAGLRYSITCDSWIQSNITSGTFYDIYYANGIWVACMSGSPSSIALYYSTNGKTWTQSNVSGLFKVVYYANGIWIACSYYDKGLYYSTDGKTWTQSNITGGTFREVYNADGIWVAGGNKGLYYSQSAIE